MSCRHSDIRTCSRDIRTLEQMITFLDNYSSGLAAIDHQIGSRLSEAKENTEYGISPDNLESLLEQETLFHDVVKRDGQEMVWECRDELRRLESELSDLQDEDDQYHEDEDND